MSDVLEIRLRADDRDALDRVRHVINLQGAADRLARWRHFWTTIAAAASIPLLLSALRRSPARPLAGWSVALWSTALLAAVGCGLVEWNQRRRLRWLLAQEEISLRGPG